MANVRLDFFDGKYVDVLVDDKQIKQIEEVCREYDMSLEEYILNAMDNYGRYIQLLEDSIS